MGSKRCYHQRHKGTKGRTYGHDHNDKWEYPWNNIPLWLTTCGSCLLVDRLVGWLTTEHNHHHRPHFLFLGTQNTHTDTASSSSSSAMQSLNLNLQFAPLLLHAEESAVASTAAPQTDIGATAKEQQQQLPLWSSLFYLWFLVDQIAGHTTGHEHHNNNINANWPPPPPTQT